MNWLKRLFRAKPERREYLGAKIGRNIDFTNSLQRQDQDVRRSLGSLRAHSRHLIKNNPFMRKYIRVIGSQVVGQYGFTLQSLFKTKAGDIRDPWASKIENAFYDWGKKGICTVCGRYSLVGATLAYVRTAAGDGETFVRMIRGEAAGNKWGFALQFIDADLLDHEYNVSSDGRNNPIVMGVELDRYNKPVTYWFTDLSTARSDTYPSGPRRIGIPASEIIHGYDPERVNQSRGVPWASSVMYLLNMLGHYWEAEVGAARAESERLGFLRSDLGDPDNGITPADPQGLEIESEATHYVGLPPGVTVDIPTVNHPTTAFGEFSRAMLKGIAGGLGVSYASLASDLTEVSYSSIRYGALEEREYYRELQNWVIESFLSPVFEAWFKMAVLSGEIRLPFGVSPETAMVHEWEPRGFPWVDPLKDVQAQVTAIQAGLDTRSRVMAERGLNFQDNAKALKEEQDLLKALGLELGEPKEKQEEPKKDEAKDEKND